MLKSSAKYGLAVAAAVFIAGWATGMGGSLIPNIGFSILMGVFAAALYYLIQYFLGPKS